MNSSAIKGLSRDEIDVMQTNFLADSSQYSVASAQALIQSLYPPTSSNADNTSQLSNGSTTQFPMGGFQYPWIQTMSPSDAISTFVDGSSACHNFGNDQKYLTTQEYKNSQLNSQGLYSQVGAVLGNDEFPQSGYQYNNAHLVYDYVTYAYNHNSTARNLLSNGSLRGDLDQLRAYANSWLWGFYGQSQQNGAPGTTLQTIAGQSFAFGLLEIFSQVIQTGGQANTLSILTGEFPALISFAALAKLPSANSDFYGMPSYGSAMVFELYSTTLSDLAQADDTSELRVRFLFKNGTDTIDQEQDAFSIFPLFGAEDSDLSWNDFFTHMNGIAVQDPSDWCGICDSWDVAPFCMSWNSTAVNAANGIRNGTTSKPFQGQMSPTLAGAIGAVVTLAALCLFLVLAVGCCGMTIVQRKTKQPGQASATSPSAGGGLGGFKGGQKLASDPDLTDMSPASPQDRRVSGITFGSRDSQVMGHERVGSWELKAPKQAARPRDVEEGFSFGGLGKEIHPKETF